MGLRKLARGVCLSQAQSCRGGDCGGSGGGGGGGGEQVLAIIELARPLVAAIARRDRDLASQLRRALSSRALNVAEGFGIRAGKARLRFRTACGSLYEAQAALRVAAAWGFVEQQRVAAVVQALDRLGARIFGLSPR